MSDDDRVVHIACHKCWTRRRWPVSVPRESPDVFCRSLKCECGADYRSLAIGRGDVARLRAMMEEWWNEEAASRKPRARKAAQGAADQGGLGTGHTSQGVDGGVR